MRLGKLAFPLGKLTSLAERVSLSQGSEQSSAQTLLCVALFGAPPVCFELRLTHSPDGFRPPSLYANGPSCSQQRAPARRRLLRPGLARLDTASARLDSRLHLCAPASRDTLSA